MIFNLFSVVIQLSIMQYNYLLYMTVIQIIQYY